MILNLFSKLFGGNKGGNTMGGGTGRAQEFVNKLQGDLNLSADQATKIQAALQEFFQEKKDMKQSGNKDGMKESKQDFKQDILNALNPEQQQKFMANIQEYKSLLKR